MIKLEYQVATSLHKAVIGTKLPEIHYVTLNSQKKLLLITPLEPRTPK